MKSPIIEAIQKTTDSTFNTYFIDKRKTGFRIKFVTNNDFSQEILDKLTKLPHVTKAKNHVNTDHFCACNGLCVFVDQRPVNIVL